ncbi:MAG: hypothetical protein AAF899_09320 [Pseudomonadota bacterium]
MRLIAGIVLIAAVVLAVSAGQGSYDAFVAWAYAQQRVFQNEMASAIGALQHGKPGAWMALLGAAGAYGFVHAVGPGHGKYLIGGVGLGSRVPVSRLLVVSLASSLAQALWAILLVYGGFYLLQVSARQLTTLSEAYLAPASYLAVAGIGLLLAYRGARGLHRWIRASRAADHPSSGHRDQPDDAHHHHYGGGAVTCGCGGHHGPRVDDVAAITSLRDAVVLVASIAVRPCTGAIFLLVIAWQLDIKGPGAAAVIAMGLGTALLIGTVAISSVAARGLVHAYGSRSGILPMAAPSLQLVSGLAITWFSIALLRLALA